MEDPGGSENTARGGWVFQFNRGDDGDKFKLDELTSADALLLGRKTYEGFAEAWPSRTDESPVLRSVNASGRREPAVVSVTAGMPRATNGPCS